MLYVNILLSNNITMDRVGWYRFFCRDDSGRIVNSGLYLYRLTAGEMVQARKLMYLK